METGNCYMLFFKMAAEYGYRFPNNEMLCMYVYERTILLK
jgi:hypothetical protein